MITKRSNNQRIKSREDVADLKIEDGFDIVKKHLITKTLLVIGGSIAVPLFSTLYFWS